MNFQMCDSENSSENYSEKLLAWIDGELPVNEAAQMEQHLATCHECRAKLDACKKVSAAVQSYCDAAVKSRTNTNRFGPLRVLPFVGAAAALAFFMLRGPARMLNPSVQPGAEPAATVAPSTAVAGAHAAISAPALFPNIKPVHVRHSTKLPQSAQTTSNWRPVEPAVQIAIPAEALFPPGAVPQGVDFVADLSITPDGSAQRLRLEPQPIRFERSR